jgi:hypothetical protein
MALTAISTGPPWAGMEKATPGGTFFKISMGLPPFVKTLPLGAHPGAEVTILGTDLTSATSVTFNRGVDDLRHGLADRDHDDRSCGRKPPARSTSQPRAGYLKSNIAYRVYCD